MKTGGVERAESPPPRTTRRTVTRLMTVLSALIALGTLSLGAVVLLEARHDAWNQAEQSSRNLAMALDREIARTLSVYDLSLEGATEALQLPDFDHLDPTVRQMALFDRAASAEYLGSILVLDRAGSIVADSTAIVPHRLNFADRDYFRVHQQQSNIGLYVSAPFRSRLRNGDESIGISRRLPDRDGGFTGVISGTMRLAYFYDLFASLDLGPGGAVLLLRTDATLIARYPRVAGDMGRDMSASPNVQQFLSAPSGTIVAKSALDGVDRLYAYRRIGNFPLVLAVATSIDQVYAPWWRKAISIGSILILLCAAAALLGLLLRREMTRRIAAEDALRASAEQLRVMATTDVLTGLPNRRAFESALSLEWRRARRSDTPLALLMLDCDWFKAYNDTYGHLAGDQVLQSIAETLQRMVRRPGDVCARHGGEEFVVLLPETGLDAAAKIAEAILGELARLRLPHAGSPVGQVTASIGVTAMHPSQDEPAETLVRKADEALYSAKHAGRNRVALLPPVAPRVPALVTGHAPR